jgi:peptide deformylase
MVDAMYALDGIGLAAPQVGVSERVVVVDPSAGVSGDQLTCMVNPSVTWLSDERDEALEGCLSLPGVSVPVVRPSACDIEYYDTVKQTIQSVRCTGFKARIVQHEVDHLDGILVIDRLSPLARWSALRSMQRVQVHV